MNIIQTTNDDGFADSVTSVRFVSNNGERALLLSTSDTVTTLGGMLNWEDTLFADVGPILDVKASVPPSAGTFVDTQFGDLDVRALQFDGQTILVYALVDESDVIIASDINLLNPFTE